MGSSQSSSFSNYSPYSVMFVANIGITEARRIRYEELRGRVKIRNELKNLKLLENVKLLRPELSLKIENRRRAKENKEQTAQVYSSYGMGSPVYQPNLQYTEYVNKERIENADRVRPNFEAALARRSKTLAVTAEMNSVVAKARSAMAEQNLAETEALWEYHTVLCGILDALDSRAPYRRAIAAAELHHKLLDDFSAEELRCNFAAEEFNRVLAAEKLRRNPTAAKAIVYYYV